MNVMHEMDEEIRAATGNMVGFKFYPNMVQGDEIVVLRRIRNGQLHGGGFTGVGLGEFAPAARVLELPFLLQSSEEVDHVHAAIDDELEQIMDESGYVLLFQSKLAQCEYCEEFFSPVRRLEVISKKPIKGHEMDSKYCPLCRRTQLVVDYIENNRVPGSQAEYRSARDILRKAAKRITD